MERSAVPGARTRRGNSTSARACRSGRHGAADPCAAAAMTREPGPSDGRAMRAPIVFGHNFDVEVILASIDVAVLDPAVREMDLTVEEWQVMIVRPLLDFALIAIWPAVCIRPVSIPFL